jgi:hypothetical protein
MARASPRLGMISALALISECKPAPPNRRASSRGSRPVDLARRLDTLSRELSALPHPSSALKPLATRLVHSLYPAQSMHYTLCRSPKVAGCLQLPHLQLPQLPSIALSSIALNCPDGRMRRNFPSMNAARDVTPCVVHLPASASLRSCLAVNRLESRRELFSHGGELQRDDSYR